jgi:hypothetical protein
LQWLSKLQSFDTEMQLLSYVQQPQIQYCYKLKNRRQQWQKEYEQSCHMLLNTQAWLRDFCAAIRRIAESFATAYKLRLSEGIQGLSFQAVGSVFRLWFYTQYSGSVAQPLTIRGSAFKARFAGEDVTPDKEKADITNQGASSVGNGRKRQRANTSSATDRQKVKRARCKACDKSHNISKCWLAVKATRPPG